MGVGLYQYIVWFGDEGRLWKAFMLCALGCTHRFQEECHSELCTDERP